MEAEAAPLLVELGLKEINLKHSWSPCKAYSGMYKSQQISVVTNGKWADASGEITVDNVGTTPAAIAAFVAITDLKPSLVINAGTAGGF